MSGTVYLLHFDRPFGTDRQQAKHYTGYAADLDARLAQHGTGNGARLLAVVHEAGIGWTLARTWPGGRARERQLKRQGGARGVALYAGSRASGPLRDQLRVPLGGVLPEDQVIEISFEDLAAGLRGWARGSTAHEQAAVELLIWHEAWLRRPDFKGACITQRAAGLVAIINWEEAREFIDRGCTQRGHPGLPASSSQRRLLDLAVALGENMFGLSSMGAVHRWHMAAAFAKACGCRLEGPIPEPGHNHPGFIPGDPEACGACAREARDEGRTLPGAS